MDISAANIEAKRFMGQCPRCKTVRTIEKKVLHPEKGIFRKCETDGCAGTVKYKVVQGTFSEKHVCDGACINAKGAVCVCKCGGMNHGVGWMIATAS